MPKRTFQPNNRRKKRRKGWRARSRNSMNVIKRRRRKGRKRLTA